MTSNWKSFSIIFTMCFLLGVAAGCTRDETEMVKSHTTDKPASSAFNEPEITYLGQAAAAIAADHGTDSGFLLMDRGRDALSWRTILADAAEKSIDAQYFLWKDDGKVEWITVVDGVVTSETDTEPMTSAVRRAEAKALALVPDDAEL